MVQLHIILDIDNTLIDSLQKEVYLQNRSSLRNPDKLCELNDMCIWERPHLKEFLNYLDKNVKYISIWTNGSRGWLDYILKNVLSKYINPKRFIHLISVEFSDQKLISKLNQVVLVKDINKLITKYPRKDISLKNTVLIDDNIYNCYFNKTNTIPVKKFLIKYEKTESKRNNAFIYIIEIIKILKKSQNVADTLNKVYSDMNNYEMLFG